MCEYCREARCPAACPGYEPLCREPRRRSSPSTVRSEIRFVVVRSVSLGECADNPWLRLRSARPLPTSQTNQTNETKETNKKED